MKLRFIMKNMDNHIKSYYINIWIINLPASFLSIAIDRRLEIYQRIYINSTEQEEGETSPVIHYYIFYKEVEFLG